MLRRITLIAAIVLCAPTGRDAHIETMRAEFDAMEANVTAFNDAYERGLLVKGVDMSKHPEIKSNRDRVREHHGRFYEAYSAASRPIK